MGVPVCWGLGVGCARVLGLGYWVCLRAVGLGIGCARVLGLGYRVYIEFCAGRGKVRQSTKKKI